jgi:hypothetical protein
MRTKSGKVDISTIKVFTDNRRIISGWVHSDCIELVERPSAEEDEYVASSEGFKTNPKNWESGLSLI